MEFPNPNNNAPNPNQEDPGITTTNHHHSHHYSHEPQLTNSFFEEVDSTCSTPYVSAPSSPGRGSGPVNGGFYYSAPASPMHFAITSSSFNPSLSSPDYADVSVPVGFEFGSRSGTSGSMSSADELFLNGKIRPMKLSTHLERPQVLAPLLDLEEQEAEEEGGGGGENRIKAVNDDQKGRGRSDLRVLRDKSMRRRTRSLSPLRSSSIKWDLEEEEEVSKNTELNAIDGDINGNNNNNNNDEINGKNDESSSAPSSASLSASSSRSSSAGRSSKRWVFLKDFLRSKSEGRSNNKFWSTISFSPTLLNHKEKKQPTSISSTTPGSSNSSVVNGGGVSKEKEGGVNSKGSKKPVNGIGKRRRVPHHPSAHELHYTTNRAQAEEMRKKTYLPYKQGLLGCLGFTSKGYGAMNGFARALNPVSSR